MREILFRGKDIRGNWHIGLLAHVENGWYISNKAGVSMAYEVIPETIGQYTGLTDKTGKKIFEEDIIKTQPFYDRPYSDKRKGKQFLGTVKWETNTFKGNTVHNYKAGWVVKFFEDFDKYTHSYWSDFWDCEVISNIHDNPELLPELLKGSTNDKK